MKKVVIAGGTGFIGNYLVQRFREMGWKVTLISRKGEHVSWYMEDVRQALEGVDIVINLAGKSINCRHTVRNKKAILDSRINTTKIIGEAISNCQQPPKLWINASASAIYKSSSSKPMTEFETDLNDSFLAHVVNEWEKTFFDFKFDFTRQIALRTSVVLGKNGGALLPLVKLSTLGLGGKQGSGTQMFSWIHCEDYFRMILFLYENETTAGVFNCTSPCPVTNKEFMRELRKKLRIPFGISAPEFVVRLGAKIIGIEPELILDSHFYYPNDCPNRDFLLYLAAWMRLLTIC
jgi:uncharacterized protein (TIGR01777 family)